MNHTKQATELFEVYKGLTTTKEKQNELDQKFRLEFNYNSNHLEGNTLTYADTKLLLIFDNTQGSHDFRELEEMRQHDIAFKLIKDLAAEKETPLSEQVIKNLNEILLVRAFWKKAQAPDGSTTQRKIKVGDYKEQPNSVMLSNGEMFHYASVIDTPILMRELIDWYRENESRLNPIELAALLHYEFVRIHPFDDGNGRVSRLIMNYVLLRNGFPPVVIKSNDKESYLRALRQADVGNTEAFVEYIAQNVIWSLEISIKAAKGESIEEEEDWKKKLFVIKNEVSNSQTLKLERSRDVIQDLLEHQIFPFLEYILIRCEEEFGELFFTTSGYLKNQETYSHFVSSKSALESDLHLSISERDRMGFFIQFVTFRKNGANTFNLDFQLNVYFEAYLYRITYGDETFELLYHEAISEERKIKFWNYIGSQIVVQLQNYLEENKLIHKSF